MLGAGQADVEQTRIFRLLIRYPNLLGVFPVFRLGIKRPMQDALTGNMRYDAATWFWRWRLAADADEGQEHQRIFQALALVQGHDLHAAGVGFQAQQLGFVVGIGGGDAVAQPVHQSVQAERVRLRFLQQFRQLQVVAHAALAVEQAEQAFAIGCAQVAHQGERTAAQQAFAPAHRLLLAVALCLRARLFRLRFQRLDARRVHPDQHGGQRRAQAAVVAGMQQGQQQRVQLARLGGGEQALLAGGDRGNPGQRQRLLDHRRLAMRTHQHRDVAWLHGTHRVLALERRLVGTRLRQHFVDCGDAGLGREFARTRRAVRLALPFRVHLGRLRRAPHGQRGRWYAIAQVFLVRALAAGLDVAELYAPIDERRILRKLRVERSLRIAIQRAERLQHRRARAEVVRKRRRGDGVRAGIEIRVHIAAAEAVDRLLGIADQGEKARLRTTGSRAFERRRAMPAGRFVKIAVPFRWN